MKTRKAAERIVKSIAKFIEDKLKLKVNKKKSAIGRPWEYVNARKGYWRISNSPILALTLTNKRLKILDT